MRVEETGAADKEEHLMYPQRVRPSDDVWDATLAEEAAFWACYRSRTAFTAEGRTTVGEAQDAGAEYIEAWGCGEHPEMATATLGEMDELTIDKARRVHAALGHAIADHDNPRLG